MLLRLFNEKMISYKKTDRLCHEYYKLTNRYYKWTDECYEWRNECYEWTSKCYELVNEYYEWKKCTTSDQVTPKHNKDYLECLSVYLDFAMCKVDEQGLTSFP